MSTHSNNCHMIRRSSNFLNYMTVTLSGVTWFVMKSWCKRQDIKIPKWWVWFKQCNCTLNCLERIIMVGISGKLIITHIPVSICFTETITNETLKLTNPVNQTNIYSHIVITMATNHIGKSLTGEMKCITSIVILLPLYSLMHYDFFMESKKRLMVFWEDQLLYHTDKWCSYTNDKTSERNGTIRPRVNQIMIQPVITSFVVIIVITKPPILFLWVFPQVNPHNELH